MESSPVREDVRFGEVFSTPTGNHRKRTNLVLNINNAGVEQVVGQYEEKLTPAEIETTAERTRRKTANRGSKRSGIPSRRREQILTNSEGQRKRLLGEKNKEEHNEQK